MKIRIIFTFILVLVYAGISGTISFFYPVVAGAANAQLATDTVQGYTIAKFISDGCLNFYLILLLIGLLGITWLPFIFSSKKNS